MEFIRLFEYLKKASLKSGGILFVRYTRTLLLLAFIFLISCAKQNQNVNLNFTIPPLKETGIIGSYLPEGLVFKIFLSCTADDIEPIVIEDTIDYSDTLTGYEFSMTVPMGKARHFSAMIYAVGPDPTKHPETYLLAGDAGLVDIKESELTVELNMLYLFQFGDSNIYIDSQDRVWFSIAPLYQYTGEIIGQGLKPQQFQLVTQGGIGVFDGVQFYFISLDSFLSQRGLDFSQSYLSFNAMDGNDNALFLGTSHGVFVFDIQSMQFVDFYDVESGRIPLPNPQDDYVIQVMVKRFNQGAGSEVWFLMQGGIVIHNLTNGDFGLLQGTQGNNYHFISEDPSLPLVYAGKYYDASIGVDYNLSAFGWNPATSSWEFSTFYLQDTELLTLFTDSSGTRWLSAYGVLNPKEFLFLTSMSDFTPETSFDLVGSYGLNLNGINYPFFQFNISTISSYGNLVYFGSDAGLIIFDKSLNEWNMLERINSYLFDNYIRGIRITSYGNLWFSSGVFPVMLPAGVKTGERETRHPESNKAVDFIQITNDAMEIPYGITITPDGQKVYAGVQNYSDSQGWIAEIDLITKAVKNIPLGLIASPHYVRLSPDGTKLYASDSPNQQLWVVDLGTKNVTSYPTSPSFGPFIFEVSADGTKGYFLNDYYNPPAPYSIKVLDLSTNIGQQIEEIPILDPYMGYVNDMVITSDETTAYVSDMNNYKIYKIDLINKTPTEFLDLRTAGFSPEKLLLDEKNNRLIASALEVETWVLVDIPISDPLHYYVAYTFIQGSVFDMLLAQDSTVFFLTLGSSDYFYVIDTRDINTVRAESPFTYQGFYGGPMVTSPDGKTVYAISGYFSVGMQLNLEIIR